MIFITRYLASEFAYEVEEVIPSNNNINGHILNSSCSLFSGSNYRIRGFSRQKHFLQRIRATSLCHAIPLLFPEGMLFQLIFYKMKEDYSILGSIPLISRLMSTVFSTSTNPTYISFSYDILTNLTLNHQDTITVLNRGLAVYDNIRNNLGIRCKGDSSLFESVDLKQIMTNLCSSLKYHKMNLFLTLTCDQKEHVGINFIRQWIDNNE